MRFPKIANTKNVDKKMLPLYNILMIKDKLFTERLLLRPLALEDATAMQTFAGNPKNVRYMAWGPNSLDATVDFIKTTRVGCDYAIILKDTNKLIGSCGIYPDDKNDTGNLGWILHMDYWKCGYGTEFAKELVRYGFEDLKLRRIIAECVAENYGSYRLMERCGMRREGLHKQSMWANVDKEWKDTASYAILAEEYFNQHR